MMASTDRGEMLISILKRTLRTSDALTYGSTVLPSMSPETQWKQTTAYKSAPLKEWFVERSTFENDVTKEYASMQPSEIRLVVAGTGVGKTTKLPYSIANHHQVCGVVLMPQYDVMLDVHAYMHKNPEYTSVRFERLRSSVINSPPSATTVYFCTAADFLAMFNSHPNLCKLLRIDFIYLDEQHVPRPDYTIIPYLVTAGAFGSTKVFYGTATAAGAADMSMEGGVKRNVIRKKSSEISCDPSRVPRTSPMHHSNVQNRVMVFLTDDLEIERWYQYYDEVDIPVKTYGHSASHAEFPAVREFLDRHGVAVLLTTSRLETGVTLNVDVVIDHGKTLELRYNSDASLTLVRRPATEAEQVQRRGRVARYKPGTAYTVEVENSPPTDPLSLEQSIYVFLWAMKFNIKIRNPAISNWQTSFGTLTQVAASILLVSRLPPIMLFSYLSDEGFFAGFSHLSKMLAESTGISVTLDSCDDKIKVWTEYSTGPQPYLDAPEMFRSKTTPPREWIPMFHWIYDQYKIGVTDDFDTRSYAKTVVPRRQTFTRNNSSVSKQSKATFVTGGRLETPPAVKNVRNLFDSQSAYYSTAAPFQMHNRLPASPTVIPEEDEDDVELIPRHVSRPEVIKKWVDETSQVFPTSPKGNRSEKRVTMEVARTSKRQADAYVRTYSSSSSDRDSLELVQCDPMKKMYAKLYPMDKVALSKFLERQNCEDVDYDRFRSLMNGKRNFASLERSFENRRDVQTLYFLSTLRVHNAKMMELAQFAARDTSSRAPLIGGYFGKREYDIDSKVISSAKMLKLCEQENYFVGVDRRVFQSATPNSASKFRNRTFSTDQARAEFSLTIGVATARSAIMALLDACVAVHETDVDGQPYLKCHVWLNGPLIYAVTHAFQTDIGHIEVPSVASSVNFHDGELLVFDAVKPYDTQVTTGVVRDGMQVYVLASQGENDVVIKPHGPYRVYRVGDAWRIDGAFIFGYSGTLVVETTTGKPVGLYVGTFVEIQGKTHGTIVSFD